MTRNFTSALAVAACLAAPAMAQQEAPAPVQPAPGINFLGMWDADSDGRVTLDELRARRSDVFASFDADESGALDAEEFAALDAARMETMQRPGGRGQGPARGEPALGFARLDTDGDGSVSEDEYVGGADGWLSVMDSDGDGVLTVQDFGPGARRPGAGQGRMMGQGPGQGQGVGPGQMMGQGQGPGQGAGQGPRMGQGPGRGFDQGPMMDQVPGAGPMAGDRQGWRQGRDRDGRGYGRGKDDRGYGRGHGREYGGMQGMMHGHGGMGRDGTGKGMGQGMGRAGMAGPFGGAPAPFQAFATDDGALWIVDGRTGDVLYCTAGGEGAAPVCKEATK